MSGPFQTCQGCGRQVAVVPDGRGFPPDIAKRRLAKVCAANGCKSFPKYTAGVTFGGPACGQGER